MHKSKSAAGSLLTGRCVLTWAYPAKPDNRDGAKRNRDCHGSMWQDCHGNAWWKPRAKRGERPQENVASSFAKSRNHGFASSVMAQFSPEQEENKMLNLPTIDMVATGQNILRLRQQCGFSVKDLQEIFGFATPQAIYKWQHGTALPTLDNLLVLAMVFDVHMEDILVVNTSIQIRLGA